MRFHTNAFSASSHGWILLAQTDVDGFDGGKIVEKSTGNALADVFQ